MVIDYFNSLPYSNEYISDEVWYVSSTRNILYELGIKLRSNTVQGATVVIDNNVDIDDVVSEIVERGLAEVIISNYTEIRAIYVKPYNITDLRDILLIDGVDRIIPGFYYEDRSNIYNYLNLEHPPLGKYIIGLSMIILGDDPENWRIPSLIAGTLILIFSFLIVYEVTRSKIFAVLTPLLLVSDPLFRYMSGIAMLDIFVALFTVVAVFFMVKNKLDLASIFIGLAASVKFNGAFILLPYIAVLIAKGSDYLAIYKRIVIIPLTVFILINIPIITIIGFERWYSESIVGAIQWHASTKTKPGEGPPISTPWEWFYGSNPFYFTVDPDTPAVGNIYAYISTIISTVIVIISLYRQYQILDLTLLTYTTWSGYVILWLIGNKSQYSFYMIHITPMMHILLSLNLWFLSTYYKEVVNDYKELTRKIIRKKELEEKIDIEDYRDEA